MASPTQRQTPRIHLISFRRTVLLFSVCVLLSIGTIVSLFLHAITSRAIETVGMLAKERITHHSKFRNEKSCQEAPEQWSRKMLNGAQLYAYEWRTFRSKNPNAPKISSNLIDQIRAGKKQAHSQLPLLRGGGHFLVKIAEKGPCSLLYVQWQLKGRERVGVVVILSSAFCLGLLLCLFLSYLWIARPLLQRIHTLAQLAQEVGNENHSHKWKRPTEDDLGTIEQSLSQAHYRILEDKQQLTSKNQALREHFANVAHDLRTPIASLQLLLERAMQRRMTHPTEELVTALNDAVYLEQLINNLSIAARLEEGLWHPSQRTELNLSELILRVEGRFRLLAEEQGSSLDTSYPDLPVYIDGDTVLLERALSNVVHNALQHNHSGGHVVILLQTKGDRFTLRVIDDGAGVSLKELPKLNLRTFRSDDARQRNQMGQGLGLAITQEICQLLQLTLSFVQMEPKGLSVQMEGKFKTMQNKVDRQQSLN